jgi:hypothetical protein
MQQEGRPYELCSELLVFGLYRCNITSPLPKAKQNSSLLFTKQKKKKISHIRKLIGQHIINHRRHEIQVEPAYK